MRRSPNIEAVVKDLRYFPVESKLAWNVLGVLSRLSRRNKGSLIWIPGYGRVQKKEKADDLVNKGTNSYLVAIEFFFYIPKLSYFNSKAASNERNTPVLSIG